MSETQMEEIIVECKNCGNSGFEPKSTQINGNLFALCPKCSSKKVVERVRCLACGRVGEVELNLPVRMLDWREIYDAETDRDYWLCWECRCEQCKFAEWEPTDEAMREMGWGADPESVEWVVSGCSLERCKYLNDEKKEKRISASYLKAGPVDFLRVDGKIVKVYITRLGPVRHIDKQGKLFVAPIRLEEC